MLQQTQISRVMQKYPDFLRQFPNLTSLAHARTADVIRTWAGMGYNNRALRLQQLAKRVLRETNGQLPSSVDVLQKLPGIGRYTANAIACFAFGMQTAVVDTNVRRVLARLFPRETRSRDEWELAQWILPEGKAYDWNQAMMELGSTVCTSRNPRCKDCPLHRQCPSAFQIQRVNKPAKKNGRAIIPNRIYRGRIVTALLALSRRQSIEASRLLILITADDSKKNMKWFAGLLTGLQHDGLIHVVHRQKKQFLSLPQ